jgi:hypothetical protein
MIIVMATFRTDGIVELTREEYDLLHNQIPADLAACRAEIEQLTMDAGWMRDMLVDELCKTLAFDSNPGLRQDDGPTPAGLWSCGYCWSEPIADVNSFEHEVDCLVLEAVDRQRFREMMRSRGEARAALAEGGDDD